MPVLIIGVAGLVGGNLTNRLLRERCHGRSDMNVLKPAIGSYHSQHKAHLQWERQPRGIDIGKSTFSLV
jgi:nucleoside-diphosphate-sugar epimerase